MKVFKQFMNKKIQVFCKSLKCLSYKMFKKVTIVTLSDEQKVCINKLIKISNDITTDYETTKHKKFKEACKEKGVEWIEDFNNITWKPNNTKEYLEEDNKKYKIFGNFQFMFFTKYLDTQEHVLYVKQLKDTMFKMLSILNLSECLEGFDTTKLISFTVYKDPKLSTNPFKLVKINEIPKDTPIIIDFYTSWCSWGLYKTLRVCYDPTK